MHNGIEHDEVFDSMSPVVSKTMTEVLENGSKKETKITGVGPEQHKANVDKKAKALMKEVDSEDEAEQKKLTDQYEKQGGLGSSIASFNESLETQSAMDQGLAATANAEAAIDEYNRRELAQQQRNIHQQAVGNQTGGSWTDSIPFSNVFDGPVTEQLVVDNGTISQQNRQRANEQRESSALDRELIDQGILTPDANAAKPGDAAKNNRAKVQEQRGNRSKAVEAKEYAKWVQKGIDAGKIDPNTPLEKPSEKTNNEAIINAQTDATTKAIASKILEGDKDLASDVLQSPDLLKKEVGDGLTKDLFTIAMAALFGGNNVLSAYGKDQENKKRQAEKMAQIEQKELNAKNAAAIKASSKLTKDAKNDMLKRRDRVMDHTKEKLKSLKFGFSNGKNAFANTKIFSEAKGTADYIDKKMGLDWGDTAVQELWGTALDRTANDRINGGKTSMRGNFQNLLAVTGDIDGTISKTGEMMKGHDPKDAAAFAVMMHKKEKPTHETQKWINKFKAVKAQKIKEGGKDNNWHYNHNFVGWVVNEVAEKERLVEEAKLKQK